MVKRLVIITVSNTFDPSTLLGDTTGLDTDTLGKLALREIQSEPDLLLHQACWSVEVSEMKGN